MARCALWSFLILATVFVLFAGCKTPGHEDEIPPMPEGSPMTRPTTTLYQRLGGYPAIEAVVNDLLTRAGADPKVNFVRKGHPTTWEPNEQNVAQLKARLIQFFSAATGGPSRYEGREMAEAHRGTQISNEEYAAFAEDLKRSLKRLGVQERERAELMKVVEAQRESIVGR